MDPGLWTAPAEHWATTCCPTSCVCIFALLTLHLAMDSWGSHHVPSTKIYFGYDLGVNEWQIGYHHHCLIMDLWGLSDGTVSKRWLEYLECNIFMPTTQTKILKTPGGKKTYCERQVRSPASQGNSFIIPRILFHFMPLGKQKKHILWWKLKEMGAEV
jgi:hypothetical protein